MAPVEKGQQEAEETDRGRQKSGLTKATTKATLRNHFPTSFPRSRAKSREETVQSPFNWFRYMRHNVKAEKCPLPSALGRNKWRWLVRPALLTCGHQYISSPFSHWITRAHGPDGLLWALHLADNCCSLQLPPHNSSTNDQIANIAHKSSVNYSITNIPLTQLHSIPLKVHFL